MNELDTRTRFPRRALMCLRACVLACFALEFLLASHRLAPKHPVLSCRRAAQPSPAEPSGYLEVLARVSTGRQSLDEIGKYSSSCVGMRMMGNLSCFGNSLCQTELSQREFQREFQSVTTKQRLGETGLRVERQSAPALADCPGRL